MGYITDNTMAASGKKDVVEAGGVARVSNKFQLLIQLRT